MVNCQKKKVWKLNYQIQKVQTALIQISLILFFTLLEMEMWRVSSSLIYVSIPILPELSNIQKGGKKTKENALRTIPVRH